MKETGPPPQLMRYVQSFTLGDFSRAVINMPSIFTIGATIASTVRYYDACGGAISRRSPKRDIASFEVMSPVHNQRLRQPDATRAQRL